MAIERLVFLTGWRKTGKTSLLLNLIRQADCLSLDLAGVVSPGRFIDHIETGKFVWDLRSREKFLLASAVPGELLGMQLGLWTFDEDVLAWGNACFAAIEYCDVLLVDEIGPLELERKMGWMAALDALERVTARTAIVVIRPECLETMTARFPEAIHLELTGTSDRGRLLRELLGYSAGDCADLPASDLDD
jgi:nucleoside-triphosphatase THEP1